MRIWQQLLTLPIVLFALIGSANATTSYGWDWPAGYVDPSSYFRTVTSGSSGSIGIATGVSFPPGYRVSDGVTVGGVFGSGTVTSTSCGGGPCPIRIQPPTHAPSQSTNTGIVLFETRFKCEVKNTGTRTGQIEIGLGVADPSQTSQPMYPYLGVEHDNDPLQGQMNPVNIIANTTIQVSGIRLDLVDSGFTSGIPSYPNWVMNTDPTSGPGYLLYPAVTLTYDNPGTQDLQIGGCNVIGEATPMVSLPY